jgi:VWFA-related protein
MNVIRLELRPALVLCFCVFLSWAPATAQQTKESQQPAFKIEVKVNKVLVPVVVRDAQGRAVGGLKKEDFQIFDKDKPQIISGFAVETRGATETVAQAISPSTANPAITPPSSTFPARFIVLFFDDMHFSIEDLAHAQKAAKMFEDALGESDMAAVVSSSGKVNSGLTRDRATLREAIAKLQPQNLYQAGAAECPDINYYTADLIVNRHDSMALEGAIQQTLSCIPNLDRRDVAERIVESTSARVVETGDQEIRVTFSSMKEFVRRMAALPGQRMLILVSPGFLTVTAEARRAESQIMDLAAESNVTISALDARGLYTTELDASVHGTGSEMTTRLKSEYHRNAAGLNEDVMAEIANGTGGTYFHNSNDLGAGFKDLTAVPEYVYVLELSLDNVKPDGSYHPLRVKVIREGLHLQARRGYFAPKPEKKKK